MSTLKPSNSKILEGKFQKNICENISPGLEDRQQVFDCFCSHSYRRVIQLVRTKDAGRRAGEHYLVQTQEGAFYCNIRHQRYHII